MRQCAYCGGCGNLTREDVFPTFVQERYPGYRTFFDHHRRRRTRSAPVVKDVCATCNNGPLATLDGDIARLDQRYFSSHPVGPQVDFEYDYDRLLRWFLKVWYNDSRAQKLDVDTHKRFVPYILEREKRPPFAVTLLGGVFASFQLPKQDLSRTAQTTNRPEVFRLGSVALENPALAKYLALGRLMSLNSYYFEMLAWHPTCPRPMRREFVHGLAGFHGLSILPANKKNVSLSLVPWETLKYLLAGGGLEFPGETRGRKKGPN